MLKQQSRGLLIIPTIIAVMSMVIFGLLTIVSGRTAVSKEVLTTVELNKMKAGSTLQTGNVVVKYVDASGNEIAESTTINGKIGEEYKAVRKDIARVQTVLRENEIRKSAQA